MLLFEKLRDEKFIRVIKSLIYILFIIWITQVGNYFFFATFWARSKKGLLGLSSSTFNDLIFKDYFIFILAVFGVFVIIDRYIFPIKKFLKISFLKIFVILLFFSTITALTHLYGFYWNKRYVENNRQEYKFTIKKYNDELVKNLENRNVLFADKYEIDKKYNIAKKGRQNKGGVEQIESSIEGNAKLPESDIGIRADISNSRTVSYEFEEGLDLKLINCIKYYYENSLLDIYHLELPEPLIKSHREKISRILYDIDYINWRYYPWWYFDFEEFKLSNSIQNEIAKELEEHLNNTFIRTSYSENITGMILVIGNFSIEKTNDVYNLSAKINDKKLPISFEIKIEAESIPLNKRNAFNILSAQCIQLIIFGWAREIKDQENNETDIASRYVQFTTPIAILE